MANLTIRPAYHMWPQYNRRLREVVAAMTNEQLVGHTAAMRVYWLCDVIGEPGAETTPFGAEISDWADDLDHPRGADELADALDSTFRIVEACLDRWTTAMLTDQIQRDYDGTIQVHTRSSILQRLLTHEAYHCGELSQTLGIHGLPQIDLWRPD
jgi:uncharacterized damage-inducible protein DinB